MKQFKVGDRVVVSDAREHAHGVHGTVTDVDAASFYPITAKLDDDGREDYFEYAAVKAETKAKKPAAPKKPKQDYKGNGAHSWETVTDKTARLRVPGGWLYRHTESTYGGVPAIAFVKTPDVLKKVI